MSKIEEIKNALLRFQDLFYKLLEMNVENTLPFMDVSMEVRDCSNYVGCDFSGQQKVVELFFIGDCVHFPAIWLGNNDENDIDSMPVYVLMLDDYNNDKEEPVGNIRHYIEEILHTHTAIDNETNIEISQLRQYLNTLSNQVVDKGHYCVKSSE